MSSERTAQIEITASSRKLTAGLSTAARKISGWAVSAARGASAAFGKIKLGETGKKALGHFGGEMMSRGFDAVTDAAQGVRDFERNLVRFQITTNGTKASTAALRTQIRAVSRDTAVSADQILAGASQYVALTGDADGASAAMSAFARISQASGASVEDVASATAALKTSMGLDAKDVEAAFSGMIVQGKAGAVEIKDMAGELATLAPQFANFRGGKGMGGIREMGSAFQVMRTGAGSASEAATQLQALMGDLSNPETIRKLAAVKIKIFDKDPKSGIVSMRNASDIFEDLAKNQKLADPRVITTIFGRKEAEQAVRSIRTHIDMYRELRTAAQDTGAVQRDMNTFLESDAGRMDKAMNNLKVAIAEAFTPERIHAFTGAVEALASKIGPVVDSVGKIGDALGALYNVGKSIRAEFAGNNNPWGRSIDEAKDQAVIKMTTDSPAMRYAKLTGGSTELTKEQKADVQYAQLRIKHRAGYNSGVNEILGAERDDKTTTESVGIALRSKYSENAGTSVAGGNYLRAAGIDDAKADQMIKDAFKSAGVELARQLATSLQGLQVEVGRDKVLNGVNDSSENRRDPRT